jgi:predicted XRE-type DNA-binding protein
MSDAEYLDTLVAQVDSAKKSETFELKLLRKRLGVDVTEEEFFAKVGHCPIQFGGRAHVARRRVDLPWSIDNACWSLLPERTSPFGSRATAVSELALMRTTASLTQEAVAEALGVSQSRVSRVETGAEEATESYVTKLRRLCARHGSGLAMMRDLESHG